MDGGANRASGGKSPGHRGPCLGPTEKSGRSAPIANKASACGQCRIATSSAAHNGGIPQGTVDLVLEDRDPARADGQFEVVIPRDFVHQGINPQEQRQTYRATASSFLSIHRCKQFPEVSYFAGWYGRAAIAPAVAHIGCDVGDFAVRQCRKRRHGIAYPLAGGCNGL